MRFQTKYFHFIPQQCIRSLLRVLLGDERIQTPLLWDFCLGFYQHTSTSNDHLLYIYSGFLCSTSSLFLQKWKRYLNFVCNGKLFLSFSLFDDHPLCDCSIIQSWIHLEFKDKEQSPANNFKTKHNKSKNFN